MPGKKLLILASLVVVTGAVGSTIAAYAMGPPQDATYVGTSRCRSCHLKEYKTYRKTKHAKVFNVLQGPEKKDPDCLKCHTTGYGKPGGFKSEDDTPKMKSVGCESCHGPGSAHVKAAKAAGDSTTFEKKINKTPKNTCVNCHNPHVNQKERVEKLRKKRG